MSKTEKNLITRIAASWSKGKDAAQRNWLECEIQSQLGCTYGKAATIANDIRLGKYAE